MALGCIFSITVKNFNANGIIPRKNKSTNSPQVFLSGGSVTVALLLQRDHFGDVDHCGFGCSSVTQRTPDDSHYPGATTATAEPVKRLFVSASLSSHRCCPLVQTVNIIKSTCDIYETTPCLPAASDVKY